MDRWISRKSINMMYQCHRTISVSFLLKSTKVIILEEPKSSLWKSKDLTFWRGVAGSPHSAPLDAPKPFKGLCDRLVKGCPGSDPDATKL